MWRRTVGFLHPTNSFLTFPCFCGALGCYGTLSLAQCFSFFGRVGLCARFGCVLQSALLAVVRLTILFLRFCLFYCRVISFSFLHYLSVFVFSRALDCAPNAKHSAGAVYHTIVTEKRSALLKTSAVQCPVVGGLGRFGCQRKMNGYTEAQISLSTLNSNDISTLNC